MKNFCYLESSKFYPPKEKPKNLAYKKSYLKDRRGEEKTEKLLEVRAERKRKRVTDNSENEIPDQKPRPIISCSEVEKKLVDFCCGKLVCCEPCEAEKLAQHINSCDLCFAFFWDEIEKDDMQSINFW